MGKSSKLAPQLDRCMPVFFDLIPVLWFKVHLCLPPECGVAVESNTNPMRKAHSAPRCTAKAKTTGNRCNGPARRGWKVCRMHGAGGGAPNGPANGAWVHGERSVEVTRIRRNLMELLKVAKDGCKLM